MVKWLKLRPEKYIAIVGHSSFIGQFKDNKIGNVSPIGDAVAMLPPIVPTFRI